MQWLLPELLQFRSTREQGIIEDAIIEKEGHTLI
jgi:hypothetical protein